MQKSDGELPLGNEDVRVRSALDVGTAIRDRRKRLALNQLDLAGLGNTGNRFVVDVEAGKPTVQLQKVLDLLDLLGLEVVIRAKSMPTPAVPGAPRGSS